MSLRMGTFSLEPSLHFFLKISIHSVVLPIMANIAQSFIGRGSGGSPLPGIKYPMKMK